MIRTLLLSVSAALLLAACAHEPRFEPLPEPEELLGQAAPAAIKMTVDDKTGEFRITTPPSEECRKNGKTSDGCFEVGRNKVAFVRFELEDSEGWQLQRIRICLGESETSLKCDLSPWDRLEFIAATSRQSDYLLPSRKGVINLARLGPELDVFFLATQNLYERWWYYQLQVCPTGTSEAATETEASCRWNIDPPMRNRGRGIGF